MASGMTPLNIYPKYSGVPWQENLKKRLQQLVEDNCTRLEKHMEDLIWSVVMLVPACLMHSSILMYTMMLWQFLSVRMSLSADWMLPWKKVSSITEHIIWWDILAATRTVGGSLHTQVVICFLKKMQRLQDGQGKSVLGMPPDIKWLKCSLHSIWPFLDCL